MTDETRLQVEYTVLGTMIARPTSIGAAVEILRAEDFSSAVNRTLFQTLQALHLDGAPIDPLTVRQRAGEDYELLIQEVLPHQTEDLPYYARLLRETSQLAMLQGAAFDLATAGSMDAAGTAVDRINGMMVDRRAVDVVSAKEAAAQFCDRMGKESRPEYITLGIQELDKLLFIDQGDLVVVGGYPSAGKTLLSLQMALHIAQKRRVGYFSLETTPQKLTDRIMCHMAQLPLWKIKRRELDDNDWTRVAAASQALAALPLDLIPAGGMTVRDIKAYSLSRRYEVIFVDYLQLIISKGHNRYEEVTNISKDLHAMSQSARIAVIALAQLSRPEKTDGKLKPPNMSSFRESGQIEQDADAALLLWPEDPNNNKSRRVLKLGKNKEGEKITLSMEFNGSLQTMAPVPPNVAAQMAAAGRKAKAANRAQAAGQMEMKEIQDTGDMPF